VNAELGLAGREDLPQLVALLGMLFSQEAEFVPDDAKQARALGKILADETVGRIYVAREGARVVAMASLLYSISTAEGGLAASFEDLIVLPDRRGRGIASALLRFIMEEAKRQGVLRISLLTDADNARAQALYAGAGFRPSGMLSMRLHLKGEEQ
jgi:ribosomal protein S18 acetylase RimI-like enzyme